MPDSNVLYVPLTVFLRASQAITDAGENPDTFECAVDNAGDSWSVVCLPRDPNQLGGDFTIEIDKSTLSIGNVLRGQ